MAERTLTLDTLELASGSPIVLSNYINGAFEQAHSGSTINDVNPATGAVIATLPRSTNPDVMRAVAAAKSAFPTWRTTPATSRAALLDKIAYAIELHQDKLAHMESQDAGKTVAMALSVDIPRAAANFRFFAGAIRHDGGGRCFQMPDAVNYTTREPVGVCGLITPWNLPLYLLSWKVAPALACGNTVVAKASEVTPRTASALAQIIHSAGLPHGVFNLVHGFGHEAGSALIEHPDVALVSFTGGTATGRIVAATAAPLFKRLSLELGGKNAAIIFAGSDAHVGSDSSCGPGSVTFNSVVDGVVRAAFTNNGQICLCGSRVFVQEPLYGRFLVEFVKRVARLRCGDPAAAETDVGPVSSAAHRDKIMSYVSLAKSEGGTVECGGGFPQPSATQADLRGTQFEEGYFVAPTVISGLDWRTSRAAREEVFGPFVSVHSFVDEAEAIDAANSTVYGLSGSVWTNNLSTAHRVVRGISAGVLWVNCWLKRDLRTPFGGMKASGVGREGGEYSLDAYSEWKNVCVHIGAQN